MFVKLIVTTFWFVLVVKNLFFWLWLWQLKEYHFGRFKAHFETQEVKKTISSFYRFKIPQFTKKILIIFSFAVILEVIFLALTVKKGNFYFLLLTFYILSPIIFSLLVLLFQVPTFILRNLIAKKAFKKRKRFKNLLVIGITGSYGKTSTKEFLAEILSAKFKVLKTKKHINSEIGIAKTILNELKGEHEIFVAEIGAYNKGKIREVCRTLMPKIGVLTGISEQHLSTFGSKENIIKAKYELIESLPDNGLAVFNGGDKYCRELYQKTDIKKRITERLNETYKSQAFHLFPWDFENLSMAVLVARELGMKKEEIAKKIKNLKSLIKTKQGINNTKIIDSTYSANPKSVISHLEYFKNLPGRKIIIMPCLIELGRASSGIHEKIGRKIGEVCSLSVITTKDYFKELKKGAVENGMKESNILFLSKPDEVFEKVNNFVSKGDIILLESRVSLELIKRLIKKP
jgi:UDP-N-acetylmuramoyl-tripeptide--D-alanyl-D-alanine ligase